LWLSSQMRQGAAELVERRRIGVAVRTARNSRTRRRSARAGPASRAAPARSRRPRCAAKAHHASPVAAKPPDMRLHRAGRIARNRCRAPSRVCVSSSPAEQRQAPRPRRNPLQLGGAEEAHSARASTAPRSQRLRRRRSTARSNLSPEMPPSRSVQPRLAASTAASGLHHRRFVHGIEFQGMHLKRVDHRRRRRATGARRCPIPWVAPDAPHRVEHFAPPRRACSGDADRQRVGDKGLARRAGRVGHPAGGDAREVRNDLVDDGVLAPASPSPQPSPRKRGEGARLHPSPRWRGEGGPHRAAMGG